MATIKQLQEKIAKLEKGISSKATSSNAKVKMRTQVKNFQTDISDIVVKRLQAKAKAKPTSSKVSKAKEISKEMKRKYNNSRPSGGSNIRQDAERPAKPIGRRTSAQGKTYYEYRENRTDRKQPPKRYPRLEDGGTTGAGSYADGGTTGAGSFAKGGMTPVKAKKRLEELRKELRAESISYGEIAELQDLIQYIDKNDVELLEAAGVPENYESEDYSMYSEIKNEYEENEDENRHSENVVLLAKHFGTESDLKEAKRIFELHEKEGYLSSENGKKRQMLHLKLIVKARKEMGKEGIMFADGGMMAKGGNTNLSRDRKFKSQQSWEQDYQRKKKPSNPHYNKFEDGGGIDLLADTSGETLQNVGGTTFSNVNLTSHLDLTNPMFAKGGETHRGEGGMYAKGGMTEHGLRKGDEIIDDSIVVRNRKDGTQAVVYLSTGERKESQM